MILPYFKYFRYTSCIMKNKIIKNLITIICILTLTLSIMVVPSFADNDYSFKETVERLESLEQIAKEYKEKMTPLHL